MRKLHLHFIGLMLFTLLGNTWAMGQTPSHIHALTVLIDFPDQAGFSLRDTFIPLLNQETGYNRYGFNGSVRQYWREVSNGKLDYTSEVVGWLRASQTRVNYEYYATGGLDKLLAEVLPQLENQHFTGLTLRPGSTNEVYSLNILVQGAWGESLRPVAFRLAKPIKIFNNGVAAYLVEGANNVTSNEGHLMSLSGFAHETGHSTFYWPEHYQKESRIGNIGHFGLMGYGGISRHDNPTPPNPALRLQRGWISNVISLNVTSTRTFTATSNNMNQVFKYTNPNNSREYFLVEPYLKQGRYAGLNDEGLAIWYVDEEGGLELPVKSNYIKVKIMEADGLEQIAQGRSNGDANALFDQSYKATFSDFTVPNAKWKDGSLSGLNITNISAKGSSMTFKVEVRNYVVNATSGVNGKISPAGTIRVNSGGSQYFQLQPDLGYEVSRVIIDGIAYNHSANGYSMINITKNRSVKVEFRKKTSGFELPQPWKHVDFGDNVKGEVYHKNGVFAAKGYGWDIWNNTDNFLYVYQKLSGDGEIIAQVSDQDATTEWAKAGVMIREVLTNNSKHALMSITPFQGPAFQYRTANGGNSDNVNKWGVTSKWVKLVRAGNVFSGYHSANGVNWTLVSTTTISMVKDVYIGLASCAGTDQAKKGVTFEQVTLKTSSSLLAKYNVPRSSALPNKFGHYSRVHVLGTGGPNLSNVFNSIFNWSYQNNGLYQFSLETTNGVPRYYTGLETYASHTLRQSSPTITFNGTGFPGLDGTYYVNLHGDNLVLVEKTGAYALYFSNSTTPPAAREAAFFLEENVSSQLSASPSPFNSSTTIHLDPRKEASKIVVYDMAGRIQESLNTESGEVIEIGHNYPTGIFMIQIFGNSGVEVLKVIKQ